MKNRIKLSREDADSLVIRQLTKESVIMGPTGMDLSILTFQTDDTISYTIQGTRSYHGKPTKFIQDCSFGVYQSLLTDALEEMGYQVEEIDTKWGQEKDITYLVGVKVVTYHRNKRNRRR